jgi:hypothetical protein
MQTAKQTLEAMTRTLPEDATFADIQYRHYTLEKIAAGLHSVETQGVVPHDEAKRQLAKWLAD